MILPYHFVAVLNYEGESYLVTSTSVYGMTTSVFCLYKSYDTYVDKKYLVDETVDMVEKIDGDDIDWLPLFEAHHDNCNKAEELFDSIVKDFDTFMAEHPKVVELADACRGVYEFNHRKSNEEQLDEFLERVREIKRRTEELQQLVSELEKDFTVYVNTSKIIV